MMLSLFMSCSLIQPLAVADFNEVQEKAWRQIGFGTSISYDNVLLIEDLRDLIIEDYEENPDTKTPYELALIGYTYMLENKINKAEKVLKINESNSTASLYFLGVLYGKQFLPEDFEEKFFPNVNLKSEHKKASDYLLKCDTLNHKDYFHIKCLELLYLYALRAASHLYKKHSSDGKSLLQPIDASKRKLLLNVDLEQEFFNSPQGKKAKGFLLFAKNNLNTCLKILENDSSLFIEKDTHFHQIKCEYLRDEFDDIYQALPSPEGINFFH